MEPCDIRKIVAPETNSESGMKTSGRAPLEMGCERLILATELGKSLRE